VTRTHQPPARYPLAGRIRSVPTGYVVITCTEPGCGTWSQRVPRRLGVVHIARLRAQHDYLHGKETP
jgi:hypothetical protein